ncbi:hypothetical protein CHU98_g12431 [Xylaria longipes]|nr:hypothetical protein CHU98_g12431 [Xylaria longipes]
MLLEGATPLDTFVQGVILIHHSTELSRTRHPRWTIARAYFDTTDPGAVGHSGKRNEKDSIGVKGEHEERDAGSEESTGGIRRQATKDEETIASSCGACLQRQSSLTGMTLQDIGRRCRYRADTSAGDTIMYAKAGA